MSMSSHMSVDAQSNMVKEGQIFKRGEYNKIWSKRYFILFEDGRFFGYKSKPSDVKVSEPHNNFTVKDCQIMRTDKLRRNSFIIRGLNWPSPIERTFCCQSLEESEDWIGSIKQVAESLSIVHDVQAISLTASAQPPKPKKRLEDFDMLKVLGKGTFGKVILCREKENNHLHAIKILKKSVIIEKEEVKHTITESKVLQRTRHPFLTELKYSFQTPYLLCFVMEYVNGGELYFHLSRERCFSEPRTKFYGAEIVLALGYLHQHNIVYRDLKLENLLLDKDGHIKIADFGLCKEDMHAGAATQTFCGTPEYLAPEVLESNDYGIAVDWWGTGVVLYEMMCGRLPFYHRDHNTLFRLILENDVLFPRTLSIEAQGLLAGLLVKEPRRRLGYGPEDAEAIKRHPFFMGVNWQDLYDKKITPPWTPDVSSPYDTKYIPEEFSRDSVRLTPPTAGQTVVSELDSITEDVPYFEQFSYHGSAGGDGLLAAGGQA